ncbi:hypothetical protein MSG28_010576 [Choristoneura fumiferana]|uniref:Uncharacterized protein n=1 Tax=Choristoneura fumiferana TaxID=7141 RepID=A0ACC0KN46_CHOFU|nr:hypothetical protein MSG28_010576 [Choristoneura fumiferana]
MYKVLSGIGAISAARGAGRGRGSAVTRARARRRAALPSCPRAESEARPRTMAEPKRFKRAEVAAKNSKEDAVFIIHNRVYDVKSFLDEHPGGHEVLQGVVGTDASEDFDDIGHSLDAKDLMKKYEIGELVEEEKTAEKKRPIWNSVSEVKEAHSGGVLSSWKLPLVLGIVATVLYTYLFG